MDIWNSAIRNWFLHVRLSAPSILLETANIPGRGNQLSLIVNEEELGGSFCYMCVCRVGVHKRKVSQMEAGQGWGIQGTYETDLPLFTQGQPREAFVKGKWEKHFQRISKAEHWG